MKRTVEIVVNVSLFLVIYFVIFVILKGLLEGTIYINSLNAISGGVAFCSIPIYRKWTKKWLNQNDVLDNLEFKSILNKKISSKEKKVVLISILVIISVGSLVFFFT